MSIPFFLIRCNSFIYSQKAGFEFLGDYDVYIIRDIQSIEI